MGTILDAFAKEDRVEVTFSDFYRLMRESTKAEIVMNAVNCNVPHKYIREMTTGKPENIDLKANIKCKDNGNVDEIADAIHKKFEEHMSVLMGVRKKPHHGILSSHTNLWKKK